jgi:hypothetical protein
MLYAFLVGDGFPRLLFIEVTDVSSIQNIGFVFGVPVDDEESDAPMFMNVA